MKIFGHGGHGFDRVTCSLPLGCAGFNCAVSGWLAGPPVEGVSKTRRAGLLASSCRPFSFFTTALGGYCIEVLWRVNLPAKVAPLGGAIW
jgi:hypothetical protein